MTLGTQDRPREASICFTTIRNDTSIIVNAKAWIDGGNGWIHLSDRRMSIPPHRIVSVVWKCS